MIKMLFLVSITCLLFSCQSIKYVQVPPIKPIYPIEIKRPIMKLIGNYSYDDKTMNVCVYPLGLADLFQDITKLVNYSKQLQLEIDFYTNYFNKGEKNE